MKLRKKALITIGGAIAVIIAFGPILSLFLGTQQISMERQGNSGINPLFLISVVSLVFGAAIMLFLEKAILSRLAKLSTSVSSISSTGDLSSRLSMTGKDELSSLADEINGMLTRLEQAQSELKSLNEKLRVSGRLIRHDVRNKMSAITINVYLAKQKLPPDHEVLKHLSEIESSVWRAVEI